MSTKTAVPNGTMTRTGALVALIGFVLWIAGAATSVPAIAAFGFVALLAGLTVLIVGRSRDRKAATR